MSHYVRRILFSSYIFHFLLRVHHETFSTPCGGLCQAACRAVYKVVKTVKTWIVNAAQYECKLRYTLTKFIGVMTARDLVGPLVGFLRVSLYAEFLSESTVRGKEFFILIQELKLSTMCKNGSTFFSFVNKLFYGARERRVLTKSKTRFRMFSLVNRTCHKARIVSLSLSLPVSRRQGRR